MAATIASRELRNNTRALLERVAAGQELTITVDGWPIAVLGPIRTRPTWIASDDFIELLGERADPALAGELRELVPDSTDDLPGP